MSSKCNTIRRLRNLAAAPSGSDPTLAGAAAAALNIINDVFDSAMTNRDISYLHDLVDAIYREGREEILDHLVHDAPDCSICAALSLRHIERREAKC